MKALILAAGYGSRLLPHTKFLPKPLFTLAEKPLLGIAVEKLAHAGCTQIFINTHHLAEQIQNYIDHANFPVDVTILNEPEILGTGGAIASMADFMEDGKEEDFWVVNADVVSDICFSEVQKAHKASKAIATLVLHDFPEFNKVMVDEKSRILNFTGVSSPSGKTNAIQPLAFTGIQILSSSILSHFPRDNFCSSIDIFTQLCPSGAIQGFIADHPYWKDIGTIDSYRETAREWLGCKVLGVDQDQIKTIQVKPICGDGSDRTWFRTTIPNFPEKSSVIMGDHGICLAPESEKAQLNAFVNIGNHLYQKNIPVPKILAHDEVAGIVATQDLGDCHLAHAVETASNEEEIRKIYEQVIEKAIGFSQKGIQDFQPQWAYQTKSYSKEMILETECRYFMESFVNGYLGKKEDFQSLYQEFSHIADQALAFAFHGLMHRDLQSRNIMIHEGQIFFIDFQSARPGPFQYDLASLLIDPYVKLSQPMQQHLLKYAMNCLGMEGHEEKKKFCHSYQYCALCRNLQFSGAFSFLSRVKNKKQFESYIPFAVHSLKHLVAELEDNSIQKLQTLINSL